MENTDAFKTKQALSWMVITEIYKLIQENCTIAELHPGGGLYNTLSLVGKHPLVQLNRNGSSALIEGAELISDFWPRALHDPREAALFLLSESSIAIEPDLPQGKNSVVESMMKLSNALWEFKYLDIALVWGWADWPESFEASGVTDNLPLPEHWKEYPGTYMDSDWRSQVWVLTLEGEPQFAFNMFTGEIVKLKGSSQIILRETVLGPDDLPAPILYLGVMQMHNGEVLFKSKVHPSMKREVFRTLDTNNGKTILQPQFSFEHESNKLYQKLLNEINLT